MYRGPAIAFTTATLLVCCSQSPRSIDHIASDIRQFVPPGWSLSVSNNTIRIRSYDDVALIPRIARPPLSIDELAQRFGYKTKYDMMLTFIPLLTTNEYLHLKAARAPFLDVLDHGARTDGSVDGKTLYGNAMRGYATNRVPTFFTADYTVFVDRPIDRFEETYPSNTRLQAETMLAGLKKLFRRYED